MSSGGHVSSVTSGITFNPPVATTVSRVSATSSTSKGDDSSRRASSLSRVTENTSNGPQKSRTSTSGNIRMPPLLRMGSGLAFRHCDRTVASARLARRRNVGMQDLTPLQERGVQLVPEQELAHRLEVRLAALELLGHGVDVPESAVE